MSVGLAVASTARGRYRSLTAASSARVSASSGSPITAISLIPGVGEVAVIGVPDERWGERVHAIIVPKRGAMLTDEQVLAHCREQIAGYKCPRSVDFRDAPLPLSGAGKILKRELREPYWRGYSKAVN